MTLIRHGRIQRTLASLRWAVPFAIIAACFMPKEHAEAQSVFAYNPSARILADMARKGYTETVEDMHVKVLGGYVRINRTLIDADWEFNQHWAAALATSGCGGKKITRGQYNYFFTGSETVTYQGEEQEADIFAFFTDRRMIAIQDPNNPPPRAIVTASGSSGGGGGPAIGCVDIPVDYLAIRWEDSFGNWIEYDGGNGRILQYGDKNDVVVSFEYDANGQLEGVNDHFGTRIVTFQYLAGRIASVTDYTNRQVQYIWDGNRLDRVIDIRGEEWTYTYNGDGRLTNVVDPEGRQKIITLGATGGVESIVMAEAGETEGIGTFYSYAYDPTAVEFTATRSRSGGREESVTYDENGFAIRRDLNGTTLYTVEILNGTRKRVLTLHNGNTITSEYDERSNLIRQTYGDGSSASMTYNEFSLPLRFVDELGVVSTFEYDTNGNLERFTEGAGTPAERVIEFQIDQYGQIEEMRHLGDADTQAATWAYTYDDYGNTRTETDALGNQSEWTHDEMGNQLVHTDKRGNLWTRTYDDAGNMLSLEDPLGFSIGYEYDRVGNLARFIDADLHDTEFEFDARDNLIAIIDALDGRSEFTYDGNDRPRTYRDESGKISTDTYDPSGRMDGRMDGAGNEMVFEYGNPSVSASGSYFQRDQFAFPTFTRTVEYDRRGRVNRSVDTLSSGETLETLLEYDSAGRMVERRNPKGERTRTPRDALGRMSMLIDNLNDEVLLSFDDRDNVVAVTNPRSKTIQFEYDANDRIAAKIEPLGQRTEYFHDEEGNRTRIDDANGQRVNFEFDDSHRLVSVEHYRDAASTTPDRTHSLEYTARDLLDNWNDGETSGTRVYDELGRLRSETIDYGAFSLSYSLTYNANSTIDTFTDADGTVYRYLYDGHNKSQGVIIPGIGTVAINEFEWFATKRMTFPGGTTEEYGRTAYLETSSINVADSVDATLAARNMTYDAARNVRTLNSEEGDNTYSYDEVGRLTGAESSARPDKAYTYDGVGNRLTEDGGADVWEYDDNNRLVSTGSITYSYDDNGSVTSKDHGGQVTNYFYDVMNRLERVEDAAGTVIASYGYDLFNRRVWKEVAGVRTYFLYFGSSLIGEYDDGGSPIKTYGYLPGAGDRPVYLKASNGYNFYHNDHLGTPYMLTDQNGAVTWKGTSDPFGSTQVTAEVVTNNLRLPGQYYDVETGFHHNFFRTYDPSTGRYLQSDPLGLYAGINTYTYVMANPLRYIDPFGLELLDPLWGMIYWATDGWSPEQSTVDRAAGFGDTISLGITSGIRNLFDIGSVDKCSDAYKQGQLGGLLFPVGLGVVHFGRHALNVGAKNFFRDPRVYNTVQRQWSTSVGGYRGRYQLHHWWKPQSAGGSNAGWNLVPVTPKLNNMMGNGGFLFNAFKIALTGTYIGAAGAVPTAAYSAYQRQDLCACE